MSAATLKPIQTGSYLVIVLKLTGHSFRNWRKISALSITLTGIAQLGFLPKQLPLTDAFSIEIDPRLSLGEELIWTPLGIMATMGSIL